MADALFKAGCEDAMPAVKAGVLYLEFDREHDSLEDAVWSAIDDVHRADLGLTVVRVEPDDFVTP